MRYLRTNTAVKITIGPFLDHADGITPLTAMTEASLEGAVCYDADDGDAVTLVGADHFHPSHHDAAGNNDMLYLAAGLWEMELTAAQTNYTGRMMLSLTDPAQICPVFHEFQVLSANVYDSLFTGHGPTADLLDVNMAQYLGTACHAADEAGTPCVEVVRWAGEDVPAPTANGTPKVEVTYWEGHAVHAHITEGLPLVDVHTIQADAIDAASLKADAVTKIIDDFETQSAADPTGFKVNVMEINGTAQTAGDVGVKTGFALSATGADLILKTSTFATAIAAAINEMATYGLTAINTLLVTTGIKTATTAAPTDMALNSTVAKAADLTTVDTVVDLIEDIVRNRMDIDNATGAVSLKNDAGVELLTGTVSDDLTTTTRTRLV
jgi:hypothetical protein